MADRYHYGPHVVREHTVEGVVLLPGHEQDWMPSHRRIPTVWPAARPPQVGEQVQLPGGYPADVRVHTITAVRWLVGIAEHSGQRATVGLAVEVGPVHPC